MNLISCEKLEKSMVELQFSIDAETFKSAVGAAFKREGKKYTIPGFRKGHAPRAMIEKMYGKDLFQYDAINDLFPENYEAAVKEAGIEVVGGPAPEVVSMSEEEGAVLKVKVAVKPEVELGEYAGLTVTKDVKTVDEADVDAEIKRMQERNGRLLTRDGEAQNGDTATIDFEGFVDGKAFEGGKAEHYALVLGSGSFIPGFEEQVVGHKAGDEFDVNVKFPEEYQAEELAGKDATFKIKLHEVQYKELPELDDDFAKDVSEYDTLDELKDSIRKGIADNHEKQAEQKVENDLIDQVVSGMKADIPDAMIEGRMDELVVFGPLLHEDLTCIAEQMLDELEQRALARGYRLRHSSELPAMLAGGDRPVYGARDLRRTVSRAVEQALADSIAAGQARPGQSFTACVQDGQVVLRGENDAVCRRTEATV